MGSVLDELWIIGGSKLTRLGESVQVTANTLELHGGHLHGGSVFSLRDSQVLLVNIHKLDIIFAQTVCLGTLEHQVDGIGGVLGLQGEDVFILGGAQDLGQGGQVDTESDVTVTAVGGEALGAEEHGNQSDVGVIHSLEGDAGVIAVEVAVLDQVLNSVDNLLRTHC